MSFYPIKAATFPMLKSAVSMIYGSGMTRRARALLGLAQSVWSLARG
jgi:hypothetical protein